MGFRVLVSRHPAIQTTELLTLAPAGLSPAEHPSLYWTHNRTCRSPASGSPTGFTARHRPGEIGAGVRDAADRVLQRRLHTRTGEHRVPPPCFAWRGSRAHSH